MLRCTNQDNGSSRPIALSILLSIFKLDHNLINFAKKYQNRRKTEESWHQ